LLEICLKRFFAPSLLPNTQIFHPSADYRERSDKIATMSVNPKSTQLPVTNMVPSMRVVGFARNVLSLSIESVKNAQDRVRVKRLITLTRWPLKCYVSAAIRHARHDQDRTSNCSRRRDSNEQKTAGVFLDTLSSLAYKAIKKESEFVLPGLGKLVKQKRKARTGINPKTQQKIKIPAKTVVKFRVAKAAKDAILGAKK
jgi:DNA-binding protein HU-beta